MSALYKAFNGGRPVFFGLALGILLLASAPAQAVSYTVEGVAVDVTAANAVKAREKALTEAQVKAFEQLAAQTLTPEELAVYTMPDTDTIMALVQDFEVTNEQLSAKRYKGMFTVRFRPALAQQYLHAAPVVPTNTVPVQGRVPVPIQQNPAQSVATAPAPAYQPAPSHYEPAYQPPVPAINGRPVTVRARFANVQEWVRLKQMLERNRAFGMRRIVTLQPTEAVVELAYNGTSAQLQQAMVAAGLTVAPSQSIAMNTQSPLFDVGFGGYSPY